MRAGPKQTARCGRKGQALSIIKLPILRDEGFAIADPLASALAQRKLPQHARERSGDYHPGTDAIQVMNMKVSEGLQFPVVALLGVGHLPAPGKGKTEAARVFYVAATQRLVMGMRSLGNACIHIEFPVAHDTCALINCLANRINP